MTANELWNLLSCYGPSENVQVDATGLKIGQDHVDVPPAPALLEPRGENTWKLSGKSYDVV